MAKKKESRKNLYSPIGAYEDMRVRMEARGERAYHTGGEEGTGWFVNDNGVEGNPEHRRFFFLLGVQA